MAKMFPSVLPKEVLQDPKRSSEVLVYNKLAEQLDDTYYIFYSSPWLGTMPDGREIDGEADFMIAHAQKGILIIEVKGGLVKIDSDNNWTSTDRHNITYNIKNPVQQASKSKYNILEKLKKSPRWSPRFISATHGVILPHSARYPRDLRPDMPLKIFAFDEDMKYLDTWVESRFVSNEDSDNEKGITIQPLGSDGLNALEHMIASKITMRVRLSTTVHEDLKDIQLKTDEQILILGDLEENNRQAIAGAAGTGKTVLAIEKAIMLAEEGKRSLLLCFNRPLSQYLMEVVKGYQLITAMNFHQFVRSVATDAGIDIETEDLEDLTEDLVDNFVDSEKEEFDAVIIDEGQDFEDEWLDSLEVVVKDGENGVLYIFFDDNQNVKFSNSEYINKLPLNKYRLSRNFRNTKQIFRQAEKYYDGGHVKPIGPEGNKIHWNEIKNENEMKGRLAERFSTLITSEGIDEGDVVVLTPDSKVLEKYFDKQKLRLGKYPAVKAENRCTDKPVIDTIRRFKGLESPIIFLVLDGTTFEHAELLYTGLTRAQAAVEIFASERIIHMMNQS